MGFSSNCGGKLQFLPNCDGKLGVSLKLQCAIQGFFLVVTNILETSRISTRSLQASFRFVTGELLDSPFDRSREVGLISRSGGERGVLLELRH